MTELGRRIKIVRKQRHFTQAQLAAMAQVAIGSISQIESGKQSSLNSSSLAAIASTLDVPIEWLLAVPSLRRSRKMPKNGGSV